MLAHVCLVLDLEGFEVQGQFLVRELGWCDWTGQHWRTTHYYPTQPYPEAWKDRRLVRFVRRHIHGFTLYSRPPRTSPSGSPPGTGC